MLAWAKRELPEIIAIGLWLFLLWIGNSAIEEDQSGAPILGLFVLVGSTALALAAGWFLKRK